jgi:hypothetical protein
MHRTSIIARAFGIAAVLAVSVAATGTAGATTQGYVTYEQCSSLSGTINYNPGLAAKAHAVNAVITGTIAGCSGFNGAQAGTGTFTATLSSPAANAAQNNEAGTYVINWPASSGLNPTVGHLQMNGPANNLYNLFGQDTGGAFASGVMSSALFITGQVGQGTRRHPIKSQSFVNTLPLQIRVNLG